MLANDKWLVTIKPVSNPRMRLFCFPYSGGAAHVFSKWPQRLPHDIEVVAIQPPGRSNRFIEPLIKDWQVMVNQALQSIRPKLDVPFAIFGHSLGTAIGHEVCRQLEKEGHKPLCFIPSGRNAPHVKVDRKQLHTLSEAEFTAEIKTFNGTPAEVLENPELMELMIPILKADFTISETYTYQPGPPLDAPIRAIGGTHDPHVPVEGIEEWKDYTKSDFKSELIDGDHFYLHGEANHFFSIINTYLKDL